MTKFDLDQSKVHPKLKYRIKLEMRTLLDSVTLESDKWFAKVSK